MTKLNCKIVPAPQAYNALAKEPDPLQTFVPKIEYVSFTPEGRLTRFEGGLYRNIRREAVVKKFGRSESEVVAVETRSGNDANALLVFDRASQGE